MAVGAHARNRELCVLSSSFRFQNTLRFGFCQRFLSGARKLRRSGARAAFPVEALVRLAVVRRGALACAVLGAGHGRRRRRPFWRQRPWDGWGERCRRGEPSVVVGRRPSSSVVVDRRRSAVVRRSSVIVGCPGMSSFVDRGCRWSILGRRLSPTFGPPGPARGNLRIGAWFSRPRICLGHYFVGIQKAYS